jgi:hypothetical protein
MASMKERGWGRQLVGNSPNGERRSHKQIINLLELFVSFTSKHKGGEPVLFGRIEKSAQVIIAPSWRDRVPVIWFHLIGVAHP